MTYASNYTNKATIFDNGDSIQGDHIKSIYDQLGPEGGHSAQAPTVIGRIYEGMFSNAPTQESGTNAAEQLVAFWYCLPRTGTLDELGTHVSVAAASTTLRLGLYEPDDTNGYPGTLITTHAGALDTSTTGYKSATISVAVVRHGVWAVVQNKGTFSSLTTYGGIGQRMGRTADQPSASVYTLRLNRADATLPSSLAGTSWTLNSNGPPGMQIRYAT